MISIIRWFLKQGDIIKIYRMPPKTVLRAHLLGLTIALSFVIFTLISGIRFPEGIKFTYHIEDCLKVFHCFELNIGTDIYASGPELILLLFLFLIGTYIGGPFVIIVVFIYIISTIIDFDFLRLNNFLFLSKWYLLGYSFGAILGLLYNDIVFLHTRFFLSKFIKISLAAFRKKDFNVIKSPDEFEEFAMLESIHPILYYAHLIKENNNPPRNADKIIEHINEAIDLMSQTDISNLTNFLPGSGNLTIRLNKFLTTLSNAIPASLTNLQDNIEPLVEKYLNLKNEKLFNYKIGPRPRKPYTIVFVANPYFCKKFQPGQPLDQDEFTAAVQNHRNDPSSYIPDPIMEDKDLFYRNVDRALLSFQSDEVLGNLEIWSRIRIITIFSEELNNVEDPSRFGLVEAMQDRYVLGNRLIENISVPLLHEENGEEIQPDANFRNLYVQYENDFAQLQVRYEDIDIMYALSAATDFDRSTALFSSGIAPVNEPLQPVQPIVPGKEDYIFDSVFEDNDDNNGEEQQEELVQGEGGEQQGELEQQGGGENNIHEYFSNSFGKVALNVIGLRQKVFIHEFAHAMSSNENGSIVDEYFDQMIIGSEVVPAPNAINRLERDPNNLNSIPDRFARYNNLEYLPDLDHPSAEENWIGYFPQRTAPYIGCTMDRTVGHYKFDPLISRFMYDRIFAKLIR